MPLRASNVQFYIELSKKAQHYPLSRNYFLNIAIPSCILAKKIFKTTFRLGDWEYLECCEKKISIIRARSERSKFYRSDNIYLAKRQRGKEIIGKYLLIS